MRKTDQIEYINRIYDRFHSAKNHGRGNNWWYPVPDTLAYCVKMRAFFDTKRMRAVMTKRQNDYYSDQELEERYWDYLEMEGSDAIQEIKALGALDAGFAGRMGGWLEVSYHNPLEEVDETTDRETLDDYYREARALEHLEAQVASLITEGHKHLNDYIKSDAFYVDQQESLLYDEEIGDIYKDRASALVRKLK